MSSVLALCGGYPQWRIPAGATLIEESAVNDRLYVLRSGSFEVVRNGVRVVLIDEPGAFLGEISAVLGTAASAQVVAVCDSEVHVIERAAAAVQRDPRLTLAIAQLLARRLQAVTAYLVDIKRQYAGADTHLALMDQVLAKLMTMQTGGTVPPGSEGRDVPDY
jgi:CRP/FNR family cyclic AMP-dependent transcriptional regulator